MVLVCNCTLYYYSHTSDIFLARGEFEQLHFAGDYRQVLSRHGISCMNGFLGVTGSAWVFVILVKVRG